MRPVRLVAALFALLMMGSPQAFAADPGNAAEGALLSDEQAIATDIAAYSDSFDVDLETARIQTQEVATLPLRPSGSV